MPGKNGRIFCLFISFLFLARARAQFERPFPEDKATYVGAAPALAWTFGTNNVLSNGGFEEGTNGWTFVGSGFAVKTNSAAEGTKYLSVTAGLASRKVAVPDSAGVAFSFAFKSPPPTSFTVRDLTGQTLELKKFRNATGPIGWRSESADLSAYGGQSVEVGLIFENFDSVPHPLDDVKIVPVEPGWVFDVYLGTSLSNLKKLGRTEHAAWKLPVLNPSTPYYWSVDAIKDEATNKSPVWHFTTSPVGEVATAILSDLPARICPTEPQLVNLSFFDGNGFPTSGPSTWSFFADSPSVAPASIVITEVDPRFPEGVEFMNASNDRVDLGNWRVRVWNNSDPTNNPHSFQLPAGVSLGPGEIFTIRDPQTANSWPNLATPWNIAWGTGTSFKGGVAIADSASNLVDAVFFGYIGSRSQATAVNSNAWRLLSVSNFVSGKTIQRKGASDQNLATDWQWETPSFGSHNAELITPLENGFGPAPATIAPAPSFSRVLSKLITFSNAAPNVTLHATIASAFFAYAATNSPFTVTAPGQCVDLSIAEKFTEGSGLVPEGLTIKFGAPQPAAVNIALHNNHESRLRLPAIVSMPAGATELGVDVDIPENAIFDGDAIVTINAEAEGMAFASTTTRVEDNEVSTLQLTGPASLVENTFAEFTVTSSLPAGEDIRLALAASVSNRVSFGSPILLTGTSAITFTVFAFDEDFWTGDLPVQLSATANTFSTAQTSFVLKDNETNTLALTFADGVEGGTVTGMLTLGGALESDLVVRLTSSNSDIATAPAEVVVPRGLRTAEVTLTFPENSAKEGPRTVTIGAAADGFISTESRLTVEDNDPARIRILSALGPWIAGETTGVGFLFETITGRPLPEIDIADFKVTLTHDQQSISWRTNGLARSTDSWNFYFTPQEASPDAVLEIKAAGVSGQVRNPIWAVRTTAPISKVVYDKVRDRMIACIIGGELVAMDLATGVRQSFNPPVTGPTLVALSPDGQFVYAAAQQFSGSNIVVRADLETLQVTTTWGLGAVDQQFLVADAIDAIPGANGEPSTAVAVLRRKAGQPQNNLAQTFDLAVFKTAGESATAPAPGMWNATVHADANRIFVVHGDLFQVFDFSEGVLRELPQTPTITPLFDRVAAPGDVAFGAGLFLTPHGEIFDPAVPGLFARLPAFYSLAAVTFDKERELFAYYFGNCCVRYYDPFTARQIAEIPVYISVGTINSLTFAGEHGLAIVADTGLWLLPTAQLLDAPRPRADLSISATVSPAVDNPKVIRANLSIRNAGPDVATNATVALALQGQAKAIKSEPSLALEPAALMSGWKLGALQSNETREVTITLTAMTARDLKFAAFVGSDAFDGNIGNNRDENNGPIALTQPPNANLAISLLTPSEVNLKIDSVAGWNYLLELGDSPDNFYQAGELIEGTGEPVEFQPVPMYFMKQFFRANVLP